MDRYNGKEFKYLVNYVCSTRRLSERCEQPSEGGLGKMECKSEEEEEKEEETLFVNGIVTVGAV